MNVVLVVLCLLPGGLFAENGEAGWLRYARLDPASASKYSMLPTKLLVLGDSEVLKAAQSEILNGFHSMLDRTLRISGAPLTGSAILVGTCERVRKFDRAFQFSAGLEGDGYELISGMIHGQRVIVIVGRTERGVLYGTFAFLRKIALGADVSNLKTVENPSAPVRWINQWDNLDGSIERGYAGQSIFFEHGRVRVDLTRAAEYARLLASVGISGCNVNNVNADLHILDPEFIPQLARIAAVFRPYGVRLGVSVNVSMPKQVGGLDTFDPLDPRVVDWWTQKFDEVYRQVPGFGGVVVKADSEGQAGPSVYGRNAADAANVIAKSLKPHGGVVFYRAFVYNHNLDWNDRKADRARAAYDIFHPLDGKFQDNVIVQIKNGPIDFQVREPVSPLVGGLQNTNEAIELQITQEYLGQQRHTVFLVPMWKEALDFDMAVGGQDTPVKEIIAGRTFHRPMGGYVGVANVGMSSNWLANHLAMSNLYGFGRLAWNPNLTSQEIAGEWTKLTFGDDADVVRNVEDILLQSWPAYERYTGPLGLQSLTNITGPHYGPAPESQERNGWGQWIRAEADGVGMDRTIATGTGFVGQYSPTVQTTYESEKDTPDELILFFHHVPYTYRLHSGSTIIQTIYDSHYAGAAKVDEFEKSWISLKGSIDDERYHDVLEQLQYQAGHAIVWRDGINDWFFKISGIADAKGRVGHYPSRTEAEKMEMNGFETFEPASWEGASGGKGVTCPRDRTSCSVKMLFGGSAGGYELDVEYFDVSGGVARFKVFAGDRLVDQWNADMQLPGAAPSADSSVRRRIRGLALRPGDEIRIEGMPDDGDPAALDYLEIMPVR